MATNYETLKVTELREELKRRNIPTTKLSRKQDIIDRLVQDDSSKDSEGAGIDEAAPEETEAQPQEEELVGDEQEVAEPVVDPENAPLEEITGVTDTNGREDEDPDGATQQESKEVIDSSEVVERKMDEEVPIQTTGSTTDATSLEQLADSAPLPSKEPIEEQPSIATTPPDDSKKRKRRSATPSMSRDSVSKKLKEDDEAVVHVEKEEVMKDAPVPIETDQTDDESTAKVLPMASSDDVMNIPSQNDTVMNEAEPAQDGERRQPSPKQTRSPNDRRYKDLLQPSADVPQPALEDIETDASVSPAIHHATSALYIRNLIRPINPAGLKDHLIQLAAPPSSLPSPSDPIQNFHVDALRTHALVHFTSVTTASRVRNALHNRVWPPEPTRKALWIDFIPTEEVDTWISTEISTSGSRPSQAKRWEVVYHTPSDGEGSAVAGLVEASTTTTALAPPLGPRGGDASAGASASTPTQPGHSRRQSPPQRARSLPRASQAAPPQTAELDSLFPSTSSKPKIYFLPVSADLADRRLDEIKRLTSRDWDAVRDKERNRGDYLGRGLDSLRRFTFEDGDVLVDGGAEFGGGGFRGGRGRGRGR